MAAALNLALLILALTSVKKQSFASSNSKCYSLNGEEARDVVNSRIVTSLWVYKNERGIYLGRNCHSGLTVLLLLAGDVELCPGPCPKCYTCSKTIWKNQRSNSCFYCGNKSHIKCLIDKIEFGQERLFCRGCLPSDNNTTSNTEGNREPPTAKGPFTDINDFLRARGLKIFHQNINGLARKKDIVETLLRETEQNIDILGLSETHLNGKIQDPVVEIDSYTFVREDRVTGLGGGVGCYIRNDKTWQRRKDLEKDHVEDIWIEFFIKNSKPLLVCIIYRPPDTSRYLDSDFEDRFNDMLDDSFMKTRKLSCLVT